MLELAELPERNSLSLRSELQRRDSHIPVIILVNAAAADYTQRAMGASSAATNIADSTRALGSINDAHEGAISRLREIFGGISELDERLKNVSTQAGSDMRAVQENTAAVLELLKEQMNVFEGRMLQFSEQQDLADQLPEQLAIMMNELKGVERGQSIHAPLLQSLWDMDFFGGEEDRAPWSEVAP